MKDQDPLSTLLAGWRHEPAPDPRFADAVWSRIRAEENASSKIVRFPFGLSLPFAAGLAVTFSVLVGAGGGALANRSRSADLMAAAYVRTIDPLQMTGEHAHTDPQP